MRATPQQREAIERLDRALLVRAGAGTGKTRVLVERFVSLLDRNIGWPLESIVAITFTEKAAREMRDRIRGEVERRGADPAAPPHWRRHRESLNRLQVSTIHALCASLLRAHAVAAGLDPAFTVLDEREAERLRERALDRALREMVRARHPALELLDGLRLRDFRGELETLLARRGTARPIFDSMPPADRLLERWRAGRERMRRRLVAEARRDEPETRAAFEALPHLEITDPGDRLVPAVEAARRGIAAWEAGRHVDAVNAWAEIDRRGGKQASWGGADGVKELRAWLGGLQSLGKRLTKAGAVESDASLDREALRRLALWRAAWNEIEAAYTSEKRARHALDFDDLELLAADLLEGHGRDSRLRETLGAIRQLMVDEYQDTNRTQQRIVNALSPADGLFVVGDAKQSIYRFRQADIAVFNEQARRLEALGSTLSLDHSFRARPALIAALNDLFERLFDTAGEPADPFEATHAPLVAARAPAPESAGHPVEFWIAAGESIDERRVAEARLIAERLRTLERDGHPIWDRDLQRFRPFRFGDAAVLFRATTSMGIYEEAFKRAGLPYLSVSGRGYFERGEIRDLLALLAALDDPDDDLALATVLRSPLFSLSDETLYRLRWHGADDAPAAEAIPLFDALTDPPPTDQPARVRRAAETLGALRERVGIVGVATLLRDALDRTGLELALAVDDARRGSRQRANVVKFLELARESGGTSISAFVEQVDDLRTRQAREGEAIAGEPADGAVQLMSVHAAKGLEFPIVVLADLGRHEQPRVGVPWLRYDPAFGPLCRWRDAAGDPVEPPSFRWGGWIEERMAAAESLRLLYVACTRAAESLILVGSATKGSWGERLLDGWGITADGVEQELVRRDGYTLRVVRPAPPPPLLAPEPPGLVGADHGAQTSPAPLVAPLPTTSAREPWPPTQPGLAAPLRAALEAWARGASLASLARNTPDSSSAALLHGLTAHSLGRDLDRATRRRALLPFTVAISGRAVEGEIDLLYERGEGAWRLVQVESGPSATNEARLAAAWHAAEHALGRPVDAAILRLGRSVTLRPISRERLESVLHAMIAVAQR